MSRLLVEGGRLVRVSTPAALEAPADLYAENGTIVAAGDDARRRATLRGEPVERLDARGTWILPGFVQAHLHLCQTLLRNGPDGLELLPWLSRYVWPAEAAHDAETLAVSARLGLAECVRSGVTAVLDMGTVRHSDVLFRTAARAGVRYAGGNVLMDDPLTTPESLRASAEEALAETERLSEDWTGRERGRLRVAVCPRFAVACTEGLLRAAADLAARRDLLIHTHASENRIEAELVRSRTGQGNVAYLDAVGLVTPRTCVAHAVQTDAADWKTLARRGASVAHCPTSNVRLSSGVAPVGGLRRAGVRVALGSDGAACNDRLDPFREMRLACYLPRARGGDARDEISAFDAVRMATLEGSEALGLSGGEPLPGGRADFVLLDPEAGWSLPDDWTAEPYGAIVHSMGPENVAATVVDGIVRYRASDPTVFGLKPSAAEVRSAVRSLRARMRRW